MPYANRTHLAILLPLAISFVVLTRGATAAAGDLKLWYDKPATNWEQQALPIGNGRLAAMIFGGVPEEHIQFNEESFWIGDEHDTGAYQAAGDLYVKFDHGPVTKYRRQLNLSTGRHLVSYKVGEQTHIHGAFANFPCDVLIFVFFAERATVPLSGSIYLTNAHNGKVAVENDRITSTGSLGDRPYEGARPYKISLRYATQVRSSTSWRHYQGGRKENHLQGC